MSTRLINPIWGGIFFFFFMRKKKILVGAVIVLVHLNPNLTWRGTYLDNNETIWGGSWKKLGV